MRSLKNLTSIFSRKAVKISLLFMLGCLYYVSVRFSECTIPDATEHLETMSKSLWQVFPSDATTRATKALRRVLDNEPSIDRSPKLSEDDLVAMIQDKIPNLPITFWKKHKSLKLSKNETCAKFPSPYEIKYDNMYWQKMTTSNGSFHLFAAYYDNRALIANGPVIRILGMINRIELAVKTHCQFWFDGYPEPAFSPVCKYSYMWVKEWGNYKNGFYQPYIISCNLPAERKHLVPVSVSLVEHPCDMATTNLRVIYNQPPSGQKENFAVCVKGLDFSHNDLSVKIVEWLELLFLLGADKVFMYELDIHPNISKVLDYYEKRALLEVTKLTLPGTQPNIPDLLHMYLESKYVQQYQNEIIPYNDCFYRNMYKYKYITLLDIDEVIMPKRAGDWTELIANVMREQSTSYIARNVYFLDSMRDSYGWFPNIPRYMHMMQHIYRSTNFTKPGHYIKAFHNTERVMTLHNHFPLSCLGQCHNYNLPIEDAQLQHYRKDCAPELGTSCETDFKKHITLDKTIWRYRTPLIKSVTRTLRYLGFLDIEDN